jgi:hypothetical protein
MTHDFDLEDLVSLKEARSIFPDRPSLSILYRWCKIGVAGVKLRTVRVGRKLFTTRDWVRDFIVARSEAVSLQQQAEELGV